MSDLWTLCVASFYGSFAPASQALLPVAASLDPSPEEASECVTAAAAYISTMMPWHRPVPAAQFSTAHGNVSPFSISRARCAAS